jgi:hypothetical protein
MIRRSRLPVAFCSHRCSGVRYVCRVAGSGHSMEETIKEMNKWKYVTFAAVPVCIGMAIYDLSGDPYYPRNRAGWGGSREGSLLCSYALGLSKNRHTCTGKFD